jgi:hypothetical protein
MWKCVKCGEDVEEGFDICWNCGTSATGEPDADFHRELDLETSSALDSPRRRGILSLAWRWISAPPSARVPRWFTYCCTGVLLICATYYITTLLDYTLVFAPALRESAGEFDRRYPNSNTAGVVFLLGQARYVPALIGVPMVMALFTFVTWRCHGVWTKAVGFSPFLFAAMIRLIERLASWP